MNTFEVMHSALVPDPEQVRRQLRRIPEMASSIAQHGLLQNLIVRQNPLKRGEYYIVAGERRWHAIGLLLKEGLWPHDKPVPVRSILTDGSWEQLVENDQREQLKPWELGNRFCELIDAGATQQEIGQRLDMLQGKVSQYVLLGRGLAPEAISVLDKLPAEIGITELTRIAHLKKRDHRGRYVGPDAAAQIDFIKRRAGLLRGRKRRPNVAHDPNSRDRVFQRFMRLRQATMAKTREEREIIELFVAYLGGKTKRLRLDRYRILPPD